MRPIRLVLLLGTLFAAVPGSALAHRPHHAAHAAKPARHGSHRSGAHPRLRTRHAHLASVRPSARFRLAAPVVSGTTYYVSASGDDANSGTSPAQPWRTVRHLNWHVTLHPGDAVLFQGGQSFSDDALMPNDSGNATAPIIYGSYGTGQATITQGVWFDAQNYLTFDNLHLGPQAGLQGGNDSHQVDHITVQRCTIDMTGNTANPYVALNTYGHDWTIAGNTIENTGGSGMYLNGDNYLVTENTIQNTGLAPNIPYGMHGIYLRASNATITHNTITHSSDAAISVRYRNSTITDNTIAGAAIGIGWFQYDTVPGTSTWANNTITAIAEQGVYVSPSDIGGNTMESFIITGNTIHSAGNPIYLKPTTGTYTVTGNPVLRLSARRVARDR